MKETIKKCFGNFIFSARLIGSASKTYFVLNILFSIITALVPYIPMIIWKELQNHLLDESAGDVILAIIFLTAGYSLALVLRKTINLFNQFVNYKYADAVGYYLDNYVVNKVSSIELAFYDSSSLHNKLKNVTSHLRGSTETMVNTVFGFIQGIIQLIVAIAMIFTLNIWILPVIVVLIIPSILQSKYSNKLNYQFEVNHSQAERRIDYYKGLFFGNCRQEIKIYNAQNYFIDLYERAWSEWKDARLKLTIKNKLTWILQFFFLTLIELIAYIFALIKLAAGTIGVGDITYYISVASQVRDSFVEVFYLMIGFFQSSNEVDDIKEFMEMEPILETSGTKIPSRNPRIEFVNVSFHYPNAENDVLKNCSFVIQPGKKVGLVGLNGSGKSTIVKLLCRFYDPTEGEILIDGTNAREYDIVALRALFGVLFQDYVKYSFTLRENVALSDISRLYDDSSVIGACDESHVSDFSSSWEKGLDEELTRLFDKQGKELSGGQWQRISLARAFFRNAPIVLLDEPSAALDPLAENQIFEDFLSISKDKSAVMISHRLSGITLCDRILMLEDGHIIEQGSHFELLKQNGKYAELFNLQASKYT